MEQERWFYLQEQIMIALQRGRYKKNYIIRDIVRRFWEDYDVDRLSLCNSILIYYVSNNLDVRYNNKIKFETYIVGIVLRWLLNTIKKLDREVKRLAATPTPETAEDTLESVLERFLYKNCSAYNHDHYNPTTVSIPSTVGYCSLDLYGKYSSGDPEKIYAYKEMSNTIDIYLTDLDKDVLIGNKSRSEAAKELGISLSTYKRQLQDKVNRVKERTK